MSATITSAGNHSLQITIPSYQVRNDYIVYQLVLSLFNSTTLAVTKEITCKKRYSELRDFHTDVVCSLLPKDKQAILKFPAKIMFGNMKKETIEKRLMLLEQYFSSLLSVLNWDADKYSELRNAIVKLFESTGTPYVSKQTNSLMDNSFEEKCYKELTHLQLLLNDSECYWLPFCSPFKYARSTMSATTNICKLEQQAEKVIQKLYSVMDEKSLLLKAQKFVTNFVSKMHELTLSTATLFKVLLNMEEAQDQENCINDIINQGIQHLEEATRMKNVLNRDYFEPMWKQITKGDLSKEIVMDFYLTLVLLGVNPKYRSSDVLLAAIDLDEEFSKEALEYNNNFMNRQAGFEDEFSYLSFALDTDSQSTYDEPASKYHQVVSNIWNQLDIRVETSSLDKLKDRFEIATEECEKKTSFYIGLSQALIKVSKTMLEMRGKLSQTALLNVIPEIKSSLEEVQIALIRIQKKCDGFIEQQDLRSNGK